MGLHLRKPVRAEFDSADVGEKAVRFPRSPTAASQVAADLQAAQPRRAAHISLKVL